MTERSDEQLFAEYVEGDSDAFDQLFRRYAPRLLNLARRYRGNEEDARDLVQQTFFQLHRARNDFRPGARVRPWLFTIALNLIRDQGRRRRPASLEDRIPVDPGRGVSQHASAREGAKRLRSSLARLPAQQREVVELHWFQGLPFAEVATTVGASLSAVKVRAHRAYKRLAALLATTPTDPPAGAWT